MVAANASSLLARVVDRYNDFVTLGSDLFSLAQPAAFANLHRPGQGKEEVMAATHAIAQQLLCVCVTLGVVPVIQATTRGPEMAVAQQLAAMLRACVAEDGGGIARDSVFGAAHPTAASAVTGHVRVERPLLLLLDRSLDLCSMLTHPSSYGGFIADTLGLKGNRARIPPSADAGAGARGEAVDLDVRTDAFWEEFSAAPLPGAIEGNDAQLKALVAEERKLRHTAGEAETEGDTLVNTTGLASAMDGLPALLRRKAQLQSHTKLLQALMDIVTSREIPLFYEAEDTPTAARVYPLLGVPQEEVTRVKAAAKAGASPNSGVNLGTVTRGKGAFMDRVRVAAMFLLSADAAPIGAVPPSPANPSPDAPTPTWSPSDRTPAQRAFSEVAAILRASGEAHTAACAAAAAAGSG
ncbi:SLY1, partial [Symbiodinium sp. KB8]